MYYQNVIQNRILDTFKTSILCLSLKDRRSLIFSVLVQSFLGFIDLVGVFLIGLVGAIAFQGLEGSNLPKYLTDLLGDSGFSEPDLILSIATIAVVLLSTRTVLSAYLNKRTLKFLSYRSAIVSGQLVRDIFRSELKRIKLFTDQQMIFSVNRGIEIIFMNIIASFTIIASDLALLFIIFVGLFVYDPMIASITFSFFSSIGYILHRTLQARVQNVGEEASRLNLLSENNLRETLLSLKQIKVSGQLGVFATRIFEVRKQIASRMSILHFAPYISKYAIELAFVVGVLLIAGFQFYFLPIEEAAQTLGVFLAAGTRIAPSVLRIQQGFLQIKASFGAAIPAFEVLSEFSLLSNSNFEDVEDSYTEKQGSHNWEVEIDEVSHSFRDSNQPVLKDISLKIPYGTYVSIVGKSGSGKSTLLDTLIGLIEPDQGSVRISSVPPGELIRFYPGAVGYVSQEVGIISGSLNENIALGRSSDDSDMGRYSEVLRITQLEHLELRSTIALESDLSLNSGNLSGGEKQRVGIARAIYSNPKILIFDEATSAMDSYTERQILQNLLSKRLRPTIISVAHRLSIVIDSDIVIYMHEGRILAQGSVSEVRSLVPDFDQQLIILGL